MTRLPYGRISAALTGQEMTFVIAEAHRMMADRAVTIGTFHSELLEIRRHSGILLLLISERHSFLLEKAELPTVIG